MNDPTVNAARAVAAMLRDGTLSDSALQDACKKAAATIDALIEVAERERSAQSDPICVARSFQSLNIKGFALFWSILQAEWNDPESDVEGVWHHIGRHLRPGDCAVIGAMASAIESGKNAARKQRARESAGEAQEAHADGDAE